MRNCSCKLAITTIIRKNLASQKTAEFYYEPVDVVKIFGLGVIE